MWRGRQLAGSTIPAYTPVSASVSVRARVSVRAYLSQSARDRAPGASPPRGAPREGPSLPSRSFPRSLPRALSRAQEGPARLQGNPRGLGGPRSAPRRPRDFIRQYQEDPLNAKRQNLKLMDSHRCSLIVQTPQGGLGGAREAPRGPKEGHQMAQDWPKRAPRGPKRASPTRSPRRPQDGPQAP